MTAEAFEVVVSTRDGAHQAATLAYQRARELVASGKRVRIVAEPFDVDRTLQQNAFYWGVVLKEIAEQARIGGQRWVADAWHEHFRRVFLGYEIKKVAVAGRKRKAVIRSLRSTRTLKVRAMSEYLEKVLAFGATDLGVEFSLRDWSRYNPEGRA